MAEAAALAAAQQALGAYSRAPEETKRKINFGIDIFQQTGSRILKVPIMLLSMAINFIILAFIFILTLRAKLKALFDAGDASQRDYMRNAFLRGLGYALLASVILFVSDLISGGYATLFMLLIYPLAGIGTLILSIIQPEFLNDITEPDPDVPGGTRSRISGFRLWSISFWSIFILGMVAAIAVGLVAARIGNKLSRSFIDLVAGIAGGGGNLSPAMTSILEPLASYATARPGSTPIAPEF